ncbi:MAG: AMP-binding protein [Myxococcaceae bacterium]|nr:AMP-binding protein [Myxococcaceae bacterium]
MSASVKPPLDVTRTLTGKRILFAGATGFVGKVTLSMLLHHYGEVLDKVYVLVRKGSSPSSQARFFDKIATSEPFQPLRDARGQAGALGFLKQKCVVLNGDITDPWMGLEGAYVMGLKGQLDLVINCAGLVSFNPSLEVGLNVNTYGVRHVVDMCLALDIPLLHMSTTFVAGNRSGLIFEDEEVVGYFPKKHEIDGRDFSLEQELADGEKIVARLREQADDKALASMFREKALVRLKDEGRDWQDEKTLRLAIGRERKLWLTTRLTEAGMERAKHWGWPNTYTYTKSLGEQVIAATPKLRYAIVRPSVVESALRFPFPGWNEGFTTSAPLCFAIMRGQRGIPAGDKAILDMIPVDLVAGACISIAAQLISAQQQNMPERRVFQLASGDSNPFIASRSVELTGLYRRRYYRRKKTGSRLFNQLLSKVEPEAISKNAFEARSAPLFLKGSQWLQGALEEWKPTWGAPKVSALMTKAQRKLEGMEDQATAMKMIADLFLPFIWDNRFLFRCDNTREVCAHLAPHDWAKIPWDPEGFDWRTYFLEVHMPGLEKWVFPGLEEETEKRKAISAYRDLLELFDASVHAWRHRVAFRMIEGDQETRFTFGEVHRYAGRVGSFLLRAGVKPQDRVLLISENRPEWGMAFFGILRAGATAVPVDPELTEAEVVNVAKRAKATVCLISEQAAHDLPNLHRLLAEAGVATQVHSLAQAMAGDESQPDGLGPVKRSASADDVASLIFTSGTTGNPKGVMLTHRNFTSLIAKLAGVFEMSEGDGVLSVLPLHHTFEFSAGFLTPFSQGCEISYIDELTSDRLGEVLETGRVNGMIGVPALWQLLHRKLTQELAAKPKFVEEAVKTLMDANAALRDKADFNLGKLLFWPVHRKFGGNIRYLVSGGSALPDEVHKAFHALGFDLSEGYGLTESSPVLTVTSPGNKRLPGTVGRALPGVELKILEPDASGIGEVIAKGPNVMAGYFEDRDATDAILKNGWLYTGDLGRIDADGRLYLVGRKKDVIIDANGKNVFPDELEELYQVHKHIKELSIVGLPDEAGGEKVACLCVPDYLDRPRDEVRRELEEHFRNVSQEMPFYRRVKILRLWDGELLRTSTRKVKRKWVVDELKRLERVAASAEKAQKQLVSPAPAQGGVGEWLYPVIAEVVGKPLAEVTPEARLTGDLGFDSLMLTELASALEQASVPVHAVNDLSQVQTVDDLRKLIVASGRRPALDAKAKEISKEQKRKDSEALELEIPEPLVKLGRGLLEAGQKALYGGVFDVKTSGKSFIPHNRNFMVIANHTSHLDMGLIKVVLGEQGERLVSIAARDYFFNTPMKRVYFENFTNLIPMDRQGSLRESLRLAGEALNQGYNLLIFPEGGRSPDGTLQEFYPTLGFLALTHNVDILPLYIEGAHEVLPKGGYWPKGKKLEVRIGPVLPVGMMKARTESMSRSDSYRHATRIAEEAIRSLRDGRVYSPSGLVVPDEAPREKKRGDA